MRAFEFGMMNLPNAAYTNAAHKNGVLSLGCIFLPRAYQSWRTLIQRDEEGNFPYADKLVEIAEYYGFDGWFVNLEGSDTPTGEAKTELAAMLKYMRDKGQYIQYYNAGGSIDTQMMDAGAADSFFKDYGWSTSGAISEVEKYGIAAVHGGFEAGGNRWTNNFSKMWSNDQVVCSIATLGTDFVHAGLDEDFGNYLDLRRETDEFQWMSAVRERMWFTGSSGNPTDSSTSTNSEVGVSRNSMPGIASMITERSVVSGDTFYTNFNTGHGLVYAEDGVISNEHEWANVNIQDILPTWQFWFETAGTELQAEYDYGTKYKKALTGTWSEGEQQGDFTYGEFDFDLVDPYEGGSSLAVYGKVDADNYMHLYKTDLEVTAETQMQVTFQKTSADDVAMSLGLVFAKDIDTEHNTYTVTDIPLENTTEVSDGWITATVDLSAFAGEQVAVIGLNFKGTADDYQMHIGSIYYTSGRDLTPDAPTGLTIDKAYDTNEMVISWDLGDYDTVKQYNVYAVLDGVEMYMGGIYDEIYYIKDLYDADGEVTVKVTAVGADGSESEAASVTYDYSKAVSDVKVETADGVVRVSWTPADPAAATQLSLYVPMNGETYTATAAAGETSVEIAVPTGADADGKAFVLTIAPEGGAVKTYDGELDDSYCIPYDAPMTNHKLTSPVACTDWYTLELTYTTESGASSTTTYTRGKKSHGETNNDWSRFQSLPNDIATLVVTLTDYDGNVSAPVSYLFVDGEPVDVNREVDEEYIPDPALLQAVREQIGTTLGELMEYTGGLDCSGLEVSDLTGLTFISGLTDLNLSGTPVQELTSSMIPGNLKTLDLTGCTGLVSVELEQYPDLAVTFTGCSALETLELDGTHMTVVDLTGCTALKTLSMQNAETESVNLSSCVNLENLDLSGAQTAELDITKLTRLHNFDLSNSAVEAIVAADAASYTNVYRWNWENAKLDLSDNTAEGKLKAGIADYFATHEVPDEVSQEGTQVGSGYLNSWSGGTLNLTLSSECLLADVTVTNPYSSYGWYDNLTQFSVAVSVDGEVYEEVAEMSGITADTATLQMPEGTRAKYVRITSTDTGDYYSRFTVNGYLVAEKGFTYGGQKPAAERDAVKDLQVIADGTTYQLLDLLTESYASTHTRSGNLLRDLTDADWIDSSYVTQQITAPKGVTVAITDAEGGAYVPEVEGPSLGVLDDTTNVALNATPLAASGSSSYSEGPEKLFDGLSATKWCTSGTSGWLGFALDEPAIVGQWHTLNAGSEGAQYITVGCRLQVLNPESGITDEDFLSMSTTEQRNILRNSSYWKDLSAYADNTENEVTVDVDQENLTSAQVYRFYVDKAMPGSTYGAIRVYELELYAYTGELGANINGVFVADTVGQYHASFIKAKEEIASAEIHVAFPTVQDVEKLIDAIGTVTPDSKEALRAARTAYENLPEDQKELVGNYEKLVKAEAAYLALADAVEKLIDAIGFVTLDSKEAIEAARTAYDALNDELKAMVSNYETLQKAEQAYALLTETEDLMEQAKAAQEAAEAAQAAAEAAQAAAEAAQQAAQEAASSAAEDKAAAEAAQAQAEAAQAKAEAAQAKAEEAQEAAQAAAEAAEASNQAAAAEARKAAEDAAQAAQEAAAAAASAREAAAAAAEAQAAQAAAEEAQAKAQEAAQAAEEAAAKAGEDKSAAEAAQAKAAEAQAAAEAAKARAEEAKAAAQAAAEAAEASNQAAAAEAAKAAEAAAGAAREAAAAAESATQAAEAQAKAQAAQAAAEAAQAAAEAARDEAEAAQAAAQEAAVSAAEDQAAAQAAQVKAAEAQAKAEAAQAAAEAAQTAAEQAAAAAEASNQAAAAAAAQAAEEAQKAAEEAVAAAKSAAQAAEAQAKAQQAQEAAEAAARTAAEAQAKAEEAQKKAEEAADSTSEDQEAAEQAAREAEAAKQAAENAQAAAEDARKAAETAKQAADEANREAAESAALAAEYAKKVAETYAEIVQIKTELIERLAEAQEAADRAEEERKAAEEARKAAEEAQKKAEQAALNAAKYNAYTELAKVDTSKCNAEQLELVQAILVETRQVVQDAATTEEVDAALEEAWKAIEEVMSLVCASDLFTDVKMGAWYHEGVDFMVRGGYMEGVGNGLFGVNSRVTRGQMATILYRIAGEPGVEGLENPFRDLKNGSFYYDAVLWAASEGIVQGYEDGTYQPNAYISRQQLATILYRYSGQAKVEENVLSQYPDAGQVAGYAEEAMNWAVANGFIRGVANGSVTTLNPASTATRAELSTILMRYLTEG